ncbi:GB1/RHD3-type G domain-containing protein [Aphelenchoides fujianensis]|nr:GB1/RHD3-type G domain-containing protein [Aphelenchoides fujianensis]
MAEAGEAKPVKYFEVDFPTEPAPVKILQPVEEDHTFLVNNDALERILLDPKHANKKVCVIGVAGKFRKGKSFLLNFFLRYLRYVADGSPADEDWLEREPTLQGFSWRGGSERDTNGILFWSKPFLIKNKQGEELVVLLMDTQGAFDQQSTVKDCATIFALSTMISSVQIYNLQSNIHEDDLEHLQLFAEYGKLALEESTGKPFQTLVFLVRDWGSPYEIEYGFQGGRRLLDRRLETNDTQHPEHQQIRNQIRESFDDLKGFLMPHPGLEVAESPPGFAGNLSVIRDDFKKQLRVLVPRILDPDNLVPKCINGEPVTCQGLLIYFRNYSEIFSGEELPSPKSLLMATVEANNLAATSNAKALYVREMEAVCGGDTPYIGTAELEQEHIRCHNDAIRQFKNAKKLGGSELSLQFLEKLEEDITESYQSFVKVNNSKNLFKSMRTPAVLVCFIVVNYVCQEFLQLFGLDAIASIFSLMLTLVIAALGTWTYSRYSGNIRDLAHGIDASVAWMWENYLSPSFGTTMAAAHHVQSLTK